MSDFHRQAVSFISQALALYIVLGISMALRNALRGNPKALLISAVAFVVVSIFVALTMAELVGHSFYDSLITYFIVVPVVIFWCDKKNFSK